MNPYDTLVAKLQEIISLEESVPIETLGSYIVGELLGDYDNLYGELKEANPTVQRISELAADLEISNGNQEDLQGMWGEIKELTKSLAAQQS